jgi:hypothetical protein
MPISGGPKEKHRTTNHSTTRFDTSIPPVILTSEVRKERWLYLRFALPLPSLRITKYQEWPTRYEKKTLLHIPTAYLPGTTDQFLRDGGKSQIAGCNYSLQHHTKQYGTSNGSPLPPKGLICKYPGSNPGNDYSGLSPASKFQCRHRAQYRPVLLPYRRTLMSAVHWISYMCVCVCVCVFLRVCVFACVCMYVCAVNCNVHVWLQQETVSGVPILMLAVLQGINCDAKQNEMPAFESKCLQEPWNLLNRRWPPNS